MSLPISDPAAEVGRVKSWYKYGPWLAAAAGVLCFLNSLTSDFVYDDVQIICENPRIRSITNPDIWRSDWWYPLTADQEIQRRHRDRLYRPFALWTMAGNYAVGGLNPIGYHVVNIALHAVVCVLVWRFAQRLFGQPGLSTIAALLFAVHPVHSEAVADIVGRAEVLAALFMLSGLLVLTRASGPPGWKRFAIAAVCFNAALFSKETAICYVPVAVIVLQAVWGRGPDRPRWTWWAAGVGILSLPLALYLPVRYVALDYNLLRDTSPHGLMNPLVWGTLPERCLHTFTILGHYARMMLVPGKLSSNYGYAIINAEHGPDAFTFIGLIVAAGLVAALFGYIRGRQVWRRLAVLSAVFLASYALISNALVLIGVAVAERLMYWPSVPILIGVGVGVLYLRDRAAASASLSPPMRRALPYLGGALVIALGARTLVRNADWSSNLELFERDAASFPQCAELNVSAAHELLKGLNDITDQREMYRRIQRADRYLGQALTVLPQFGQAMQLRGRVRGMLGDRQGAIEYFEMATRLTPLDRVSQELLASLKDESGAAAAALDELGGQVTTRPADPELRLKYGEALLHGGRYHEALPELQEAARLAPASGEALRLLGEAYAVMNEPEKAIDTLREAELRAPDDWRVQVNLSGLLYGRDNAASLRHAQQAQRLAPAGLEANLALAEALAVNDRRPQALALYRQILRSMSQDNPLHAAVEARLHDLETGRP